MFSPVSSILNMKQADTNTAQRLQRGAAGEGEGRRDEVKMDRAAKALLFFSR